MFVKQLALHDQKDGESVKSLWGSGCRGRESGNRDRCVAVPPTAASSAFFQLCCSCVCFLRQRT